MMSEQERIGQMPIPQDDGVPAPPRFLLWLVIGLFLLGIIGVISGVVVFRNVLRPGQQQRVIGVLPFMENFLPTRGSLGDTLPTAVPADNTGISPEDLLSAPLEIPATKPVEKPTQPVIVVEATQTPTATLTSTPAPTETRIVLTPTATLEPTQVSAAPTQPAQTNPVSSAPTEVELVSGLAINNTGRPANARLYGFTHVKQTWNNCGPANITMGLSYYGWAEGQDVAASFLKPDREDKNVNPSEMVSFVNERTGVRAITRIGGDMELLKNLLANNLPVIIETGYMPEGYDWLGHYQTVVGYDDAQRVFYVYDSYLGAGENGSGIAEPYTEFDTNWQAFNRVFIVIYSQEQEGLVAQILGERADVTKAAEIALSTAQAEARANPQNAFAWFNMGTALTRLERYDEAAVAYDQARRAGLPWRMLWYQFGPFEAYYNVQRYDDVTALVDTNLTNGAEYVEETFYWQGRVLAAQGRTQAAAGAFNQALSRNPFFTAAQTALDELNTNA
jgi:hypothetical protein